jgi:hypothetical protein
MGDSNERNANILKWHSQGDPGEKEHYPPSMKRYETGIE